MMQPSTNLAYRTMTCPAGYTSGRAVHPITGQPVESRCQVYSIKRGVHVHAVRGRAALYYVRLPMVRDH
jgi:hypothetical protein